MEYDCDNCLKLKREECAGLVRNCQGFVPLQRVDPEILKAALEAHDHRMHKENYYGSRNTQKREAAVKKARAKRDQQEQQVKPEPVHREPVKKEAAAALRKGQEVQAERNKQEQRVDPEQVRQKPEQEDAAAALRAWRKAQARAEKLPAYCVFPDKTLNALATARIRRKADLLDVSGIGGRLYAKYGNDLFEILSGFNTSP